jgi:peptidoglycan/xylan/chitin deacetylase (PgdA/CDA1 family)
MKRYYKQLSEEIEEKDTRAWNFPELINFYTEKGWHATFFFLAKWLEGRHLRYNIRSKKFISLFAQLRQTGHEIALHPSKYAFDKASAYRDEKNKLASVSAVKVQGMRQHYLRAKFPRLWVLAEQAGLLYDASLGYNFQSGFRAGTTFPFQTYDYTEEKLLSLTEFSLHLFEYNLPRSPADDSDFRPVINKVVGQVAKYGGLFVALLHPSNYNREPYRSQWDYLLAALSGYKIFVASLAEHLKWRRQRERIKLAWSGTEEQKQRLMINLPGDLKIFSLEIIGGRLSPGNKHLESEEIGSGCYRLKTSEQKVSVTLISDAR